MRSGTSRYQRYSSWVHERSQLFSATVEPGLSGYGLPVVGSVPVRDAAHREANVDEGAYTPAVHDADPAPPLEPWPLPPQAVAAVAAAMSQARLFMTNDNARTR